MVPLLSCSLFDVTGDEDAKSGRGAKLFDPYQGLNSGALRLSLQYYNGCAMLPTGQMVANNAANVPYPQLCDTPQSTFDPFLKTPPTGKLKLVTNTPYFLNQFTATDTVVNLHTNTKDLSDALKWIETQSWMKKLDWGNVGASFDDWIYNAPLPGIFEESWTREVRFEHPNWERVKDDKFTIEVLDQDGTVRSKVDYLRSELLASTPFAGHSRTAWRMEGGLPPRYPGDVEARGVTARPGNLPQGIGFRTIARLDLVGSTNPFKTFTTPAQPGDGAIRVTWSQMPDDPFYFPVTFVAKEDLPVSCFDEAGQPRPCGFGLDPQLGMEPPTEGSFYKPGETVKMVIDIRDADGNRLHSPDYLPTVADLNTEQSSGLLSFVNNLHGTTLEADSDSAVGVAGPLQEMKVQRDPLSSQKDFFGVYNYPIDQTAGARIVPTLFYTPWPTHLSYKLPADAKPGTYVVFVKASRYFMGERITKMKPFTFQVGQDEETRLPGRIGNCQICHRGVLSLDNLRHGLPVDYVEGCKTCHESSNDATQRTQEVIHRIHMNSPRFTAAKNDCTLCHLTRESATRPSVTTCASCHPSQHGDKYFQLAFANSNPGRFSNCAQSCHADQTPKFHILPEN